MTPRQTSGNAPMTSAERVRRSRWVNRLENTAFKLIDLLDDAPDPLPRIPSIPKELIEKLEPFVGLETKNKTGDSDMSRTATRVLKLGNGNQMRNKKVAMKFIASYLNAEIIDNKTIHTKEWGSCHVSAYTHPKGAMISTPNRDDQDYGGVDWHENDHIILFRDVGDGLCILYINKIEPLFEHRTIGHHGVIWDDIRKLSSHVEILRSEDVLKALDL